MKKTYIKPEIEVMALETEAQMMTTSPNIHPGFGNGEADGSTPLSTGRRGAWGNLWDGE